LLSAGIARFHGEANAAADAHRWLGMSSNEKAIKADVIHDRGTRAWIEVLS
jgi:hypothetical protein